MKKKSQANLKYIYKSARYLFSSLIIFTIFILFITTSIIVNASQTNNSIQNSNSQSIPANLIDKFNSTDKWKTVLDTRPNINLTIKYPSGWDEKSDFCIKAPNPKSLDLSSNCLRMIVVTNQLPPDDESSIGRDIVLTSKTQIVVNGYKAIRKIYSLPDDPENTPDTYQLWIYDKDQPFVLIIGWIGEETDNKTAKMFMKTLDRMINTLKLHKK